MERFRYLHLALVVLIPTLFYGVTVSPTIGFGDTAILIDAIQRGLVSSHVNNHPLTVLAGMLYSALLPFGELAFRANLVSATFGVMAVVVFYAALVTATGSRAVAAVSSLLLMVSHSMWWHSTLIESYATSAFLTALCLLWAASFSRTGRDSYLYALCFTGALGLLNHVQMGFICVGIAITGIGHAWQSGHGWRVLRNCALTALLGLSPWGLLVAREAASLGFAEALRSAFVGNFSDTFFSGGAAASLLDTLYLFWFQSPTLYLLVFGVAGFVVVLREGWKDPASCGFFVAFVLNSATFAFYATWDKFAFLLISFVILFFYAGVALDRLLSAASTRKGGMSGVWLFLVLSLVLPLYLYQNIATWARDPESAWFRRYNNLYAANLYFQSEYIVNPNKSLYSEVDRFAAMLFTRLPKGAVFLDDDSRTYYPLADYYQKYYGVRPDVTVVMVNSWGMDNWGMSGASLTEVMGLAYLLDRPFFVATLQAPVSTFLKNAAKEFPVEFEPFNLGEGRVIYRLLTQTDRNAVTDRLAALRGYGYAPLPLAAPAGYLDMSRRHLLYFATVEPVEQDMSSFVGAWRGGDHLLMNNVKKGGYVEVGILADTSGSVAVTLELTAAPDFGIVEVSLGARKKVIDLYSTVVERRQVDLGVVQLGAGETSLTVTAMDKNPASSGYKFGLDGLSYRWRN